MKNHRRKAAARKAQSASKTPTPETITLTLEQVAFGGDALARVAGKVYFVADALPEETVLCELTQDKDRFAKARVLQRLKAPSYALEAPCEYAARCGGCQWQRVPYPQQLQWKKSFIQDALQRIGGIEAGSYPLTMEASPDALRYRNRIDLKWQVQTDGSLRLGYFAKGSHELVSIKRCLIADAALDAVIERCRSLRFPKRERPWTVSIELQATADGRVLLACADDQSAFWRDLTEAIQDDPWLSAQLILDNKSFVLLEEWEGLHFYTRAGQFQQVNIPANRFLRAWIRQYAQKHGARTVLDLYCGSGNLSLPLARDGLAVFGVEAFAPSIDAALYNVSANDLKAAHYAAGDAQDIRELFPQLPAVDLLLLDPPRRGLGAAVEPILALDASQVIYVSCDPNTLARDLKRMLESGYALKEVLGLDFFPQSYHVETVCVLQRQP